MAGSLRARVLEVALAGARDALETIEARVAEQLTAGTKARQRERTREVLERDRALLETAVPADPPPAARPFVAPGTAPGVTRACESEPECSEPIRTRSMAKLLAGQGYPHRALAIYRYLLAADDADETLHAEIAALQAHLGAHEHQAVARALAD